MRSNFFKNFKLNQILVNIFVIAFVFVLPLFTFAQGDPVSTPTPDTGITYECQRTENGQIIYGDCGYNNLIEAVKRVIDWMIVFTLSFSVVVIVYAGINYMISGDNPGKRAEANKMLWKVVLGIFFTLAAWLIVNLIASELLTPEVIDVTPVVTP